LKCGRQGSGGNFRILSNQALSVKKKKEEEEEEKCEREFGRKRSERHIRGY
jgi:hypothetical protein